jgi:hypothetical protein
MSDGGGFPVGIGAGMAVGIGMGVGVGKKKAKEAILKQAASRSISLRDSSGNEIPMEQFLEETLRTETKPKGLTLVVVILGALVALAMVVYLVYSR